MAQNYKIPPKLGENISYETWKNEIEMWRLVTDLKESKQALAIALSLTGKARDTALEIKADDLNQDEGVTTLLKKLDLVFQKDTIDSAYEAYTKFEQFRQSENMSMGDYVAQFELLHTKTSKHDMSLPDAVLAFKLLDKTLLSERDRQLALTACSDIKFSTMKSSLKRIFGGHGHAIKSEISLQESQESVLAVGNSRNGGRYYSNSNNRPRPNIRNTSSRPTNVRSYSVRQTNEAQKPRPQSNDSTGTYTNDAKGVQKGTNPLNRFGKRSKCAICESVFHWARDCPDKSYDQSVNLVEEEHYPISRSDDLRRPTASTTETFRPMPSTESVNITLFSKNEESQTKNEIFMIESYGAAVLDTACTKTVCGKRWLNDYISELSDFENKNITISESNQEFRFGDGALCRSTENCVIPAIIGNTTCKISTEVVDCDIPLLLSKDSLKKANTVLDLQNDTATMFGKPINLEFTSSGHYCVSITKKDHMKMDLNQSAISDPDNVEVLAVDSQIVDDQSFDEINITEPDPVDQVWDKKKLVKLHKQFGHASVAKLMPFLKGAGVTDENLYETLSDVVKECQACMKFKRTPPKPAVCLPLAQSFNDCVAMDLHEIKPNVWYLHIIDLFSRYSAASIITSKQSNVIAKQFLLTWISIHGPPKSILTDNGREFDNREMHDLAENFNIVVKTTPAYSPWSNGLIERHNRTLTEILNKVGCDKSLDLETALAWSVNAKNTLDNVHGFSSHQLVYGHNPCLPSTLTDELPALEGTTTSECVAKHVTALHATRKAFIKAESSERIRRALRKQTRSSDKFTTGDSVFYKRADNNEWKGPGVVIGQDGVVVFVRHGGSYIRAHRCRLVKMAETCVPEQNIEPMSKQEKVTVDKIENEQEESLDNNSTNEEDIAAPEADPVIPNPQVTTNDENIVSPRIGCCMKFKDQDGEAHVIKVLSRAGKATGNLKHWYNVEFVAPAPVIGVRQSIDLKSVNNLEMVNYTGEAHEESILALDHLSFNQAKKQELEKWKDFSVYQVTPYRGQKCISTRWVCTIKETKDGSIQKARLVVRGFEDTDRHGIQKDSPTCAKESLRIVLAIAAQKGWKPHTMDIKTAFLQGMDLSRDIFIWPPKEAGEKDGHVWHLRKCVYGLIDASMHWYKKVKEVMIKCGATTSNVDPAIFYWNSEGSGLKGILASHVDDFLWAGNNNFEQTVISQVRMLLNVGQEESDSFRYIGLDLCSLGGNILLSQKHYANSIQPIQISKNRASQKDSKLDTTELDIMRSRIGQILWVANQTRPDVSFDASTLASAFKNGTVANILETNKVIRKVQSENVCLKFQQLGGDSSVKLVIYSDASLGNLSDGGSQGGYFIILTGDNGLFSPIAWQSKKIRRVVRSTLSAEALALSDAVDVGVYLAQLYTEVTVGEAKPELLPIECITDNHSLFDTIHSTNHVKEKRLRMEISSIKELLMSQQIQTLRWSPTKTQLADCLTKSGASSLALLKLLEEGVWGI